MFAIHETYSEAFGHVCCLEALCLYMGMCAFQLAEICRETALSEADATFTTVFSRIF
jgi:hypothetical protein